MKSYHGKNVSSLLRELMKFDVISFDIFDTLVLRPFTNPEDIFLTLSPEHKLVNFQSIRMQAEKEVRNKTEEKFGNREVTITQIYEQIAKETEIDIEKGIEMEFQKELAFCYANPYMKTVFDVMKQEGKKIIIVSNMYYPEKMMEQILESCGYTGYDKLFVSCDYHRNKRNGELFRYVSENYIKGKSVIHIGDNQEADIEGAALAGWETYYYAICTKKEKNFHKQNLSYLTGSYYNAIVENFNHNGFSREECQRTGIYYWMGYKYGGIVLLGYVNFIHQYCVEHKIDKILFLSRDGYMLKKLYDSLYMDIPSEYVLWSRRATLQVLPHIYFGDLFTHTVQRRLKEGLTGKKFLKEMGLSELAEEISFHTKEKITKDNVDEFRSAIMMKNKRIRELSSDSRKAAGMYLKPILKNCSRVAIVDIGWRASGGIALDKLINDEWQMNCQVDCIVAGNMVERKGNDTTFVMSKKIVSYLFSENNNLDIGCNFEAKVNCLMPVFEIFCGAALMPSFLGFELDGEDYHLKFDRPESENYEILKKIYQGEMDFCKEYIEHSKGYPALLQITGRDAYKIFSSIFREKGLEKGLKNYSYPHNIGGVNNRWLIETLGEIWSLKKLNIKIV